MMATVSREQLLNLCNDSKRAICLGRVNCVAEPFLKNAKSLQSSRCESPYRHWSQLVGCCSGSLTAHILQQLDRYVRGRQSVLLQILPPRPRPLTRLLLGSRARHCISPATIPSRARAAQPHRRPEHRRPPATGSQDSHRPPQSACLSATVAGDTYLSPHGQCPPA